MGSGRETIEPRGKAHKPADSGVVVGNGARIRSPAEVLASAIKRRRERCLFDAARTGRFDAGLRLNCSAERLPPLSTHRIMTCSNH